MDKNNDKNNVKDSDSDPFHRCNPLKLNDCLPLDIIYENEDYIIINKLPDVRMDGDEYNCTIEKILKYHQCNLNPNDNSNSNNNNSNSYSKHSDSKVIYKWVSISITYIYKYIYIYY